MIANLTQLSVYFCHEVIAHFIHKSLHILVGMHNIRITLGNLICRLQAILHGVGLFST
jgi:hypothetical protein